MCSSDLVAVQHQRAWGERREGGVVEGRDIGSVVFPDATLKVFLTASVDERARRRLRDEEAAGRHPDLDALRDQIARRDHLDSTRAVSPLIHAPDAVVVDTTGRTIDDVVEEIAARYADAVMTMPAATVSFDASSVRMNAPVARLSAYGSTSKIGRAHV